MIRILFVFFGTLAPLMAVPLSNNQNEVKNPLDKVLIGYDKRVRPYFGSGRPVTVGVSAYVLSISSISEVDMVNWSFYSTFLWNVILTIFITWINGAKREMLW